MRVQTQNIGIQLKSRAIYDPAKIKASKGVVIQREDARTPKKRLNATPILLF